MNDKLKCVLVIDDDDVNSVIIGMLLQQSGCVEKTAYFKSGYDALEYLKSDDDEAHPKPELILLDVIMPKMDGWDFIEEYKKSVPLDIKPVISMFSWSESDSDREKARAIPEIHDYINKPLNYLKIDELIKTHFPNRN